ncbi:hypothetical protein GCM10010124_14930 [Pilimelia terevasa]|uniref:Lipoprotein n=1 Tax=Pilimelia terevasa TaxID=53372 RepID=A0A8J3BJ87_9ACTN|nr:hypothetical protein [Pilimelia terevasa]GGK23476.1 hypothetical protein GCM10010124_14930 [Pilimelia terevasa]
MVWTGRRGALALGTAMLALAASAPVAGCRVLGVGCSGANARLAAALDRLAVLRLPAALASPVDRGGGCETESAHYAYAQRGYRLVGAAADVVRGATAAALGDGWAVRHTTGAGVPARDAARGAAQVLCAVKRIRGADVWYSVVFDPPRAAGPGRRLGVEAAGSVDGVAPRCLPGNTISPAGPAYRHETAAHDRPGAGPDRVGAGAPDPRLTAPARKLG